MGTSHYYLIGIFLYLWFFWYAYILVMGLYRAHLDKRLNNFTYFLAAPALTIGYAMDIVANLTIATIIFLEPPKELLVTTRMLRHNKGPNTWRKRVATYICDHLLDVFDPKGDHC